MLYLHKTAAVPNRLITDKALHYTTKRVAVTLLFLRGRNQTFVRVSVEELSRLSGVSMATVQQSVRELIAQGYLVKRRRYRYGSQDNHLIYDTNEYAFRPVDGGYTIVRREIMNYRVTAAAFCVLLFLYHKARRDGRAYPSLRQIAGLLRDVSKQGLNMSKSTVCAALRALCDLCAAIRLRCKTRRGCYAASSYLLTNVKSTSNSVVTEGSTIFDKPTVINQITKELTLRVSDRDVNKDNCKFVILPNYGRFDENRHTAASTYGGQYKLALWHPKPAYTPRAIPPPMRC